jgi:hypothetical protein
MTSAELIIIIIQIITTGFIALTFIVYHFQLKATNKQVNVSSVQNILSLSYFLQNDGTRKSRRYVIQLLKDKEYETWNDEDIRHASNVCSTYDLASIIIKDQLVPLEIFANNWGPSIKKCYKIVEPHILSMQLPQNAGPNYWNDFKWLYDEVIKRNI